MGDGIIRLERRCLLLYSYSNSARGTKVSAHTQGIKQKHRPAAGKRRNRCLCRVSLFSLSGTALAMWNSLSAGYTHGPGLFVLVLLADNSIYVTGYMPSERVRAGEKFAMWMIVYMCMCSACSQSATLRCNNNTARAVVALNRQPGRQTCPAKCLVRIMQHKTHTLSCSLARSLALRCARRILCFVKRQQRTLCWFTNPPLYHKLNTLCAQVKCLLHCVIRDFSSGKYCITFGSICIEILYQR
jgi:hypothetical protein